jgi:hypothetical protein
MTLSAPTYTLPIPPYESSLSLEPSLQKSSDQPSLQMPTTPPTHLHTISHPPAPQDSSRQFVHLPFPSNVLTEVLSFSTCVLVCMRVCARACACSRARVCACVCVLHQHNSANQTSHYTILHTPSSH